MSKELALRSYRFQGTRGRAMRFWRRDFESSVKGELALLFRCAKRLAGSSDEAEDLVQATLIKGFQAWDSFDGRYLRSWLLSILRNEHLARVRQRRPTTSLYELECDEPADEDIWNSLVTRDQAARIREELDKLPLEYRMAVHLCDVEELSYEEAAHAMDVPIGTVRSRLFRGRTMLRMRLEPNLSAAGEPR